VVKFGPLAFGARAGIKADERLIQQPGSIATHICFERGAKGCQCWLNRIRDLASNVCFALGLRGRYLSASHNLGPGDAAQGRQVAEQTLKERAVPTTEVCLLRQRIGHDLAGTEHRTKADAARIWRLFPSAW
jgi:hypothetical protein